MLAALDQIRSCRSDCHRVRRSLYTGSRFFCLSICVDTGLDRDEMEESSSQSPSPSSAPPHDDQSRNEESADRSDLLSRGTFFERVLKRDADEKIVYLESELTSLKEKYDTSTAELDSAQKRTGELEESLNQIKNDLHHTQELLKSHKTNSENFRLQRDSALEVQDSLNNMIETRDTEISSLKIAIENLQQNLQSVVNVKCDTLFKIKDVHSKSIIDAHKDIYSGRGKTDHSSQIEILQSELHRYMTDLQTVQENMASLKINFERQLAKKNDELNMSNIKISKLEEIKDNLNKRINSINKKFADHIEKEQKAIDEYKNELVTKTKMIDLYKSNQEDANMKNEELTQFVSELKQLLNQCEEKNKELLYNLEKNESEHKEALDKKEDTITILKRELENANELLQMADGDFSSCLENLSPSAAIASKFIKSRMSITQAYDHIVKLSEELELEKNEKKRLNNTLSSIVKELEERSPFIEQQQAQYEKMLEMKEALNEQLQTLIVEHKQLKNDNSEVLKLSVRYQKDNNKLKLENEDLSRQICCLLKEIETRKGSSFSYDDTLSCSNQFDLNSSGVISEKLVTFKDINDLQNNNQKLLKIVRELSEKKEEFEKSKDQSDQMDTEDIGTKIDNLKTRITELTEAQDRQVKMINGLVRQRDMYKKMCEDRDISMNMDKCDDSFDFSVTGKSDMAKNFSDKSQYIELLESQLENLKKELIHEGEMHKTFVEKAKSKEVKLVEMHDAAHKQFNEVHSKYVKCLSSSESLNEKSKMLQIELSSSKREVASLNERITSYSNLIGKQESYAKKLNDELSSSRKKLSQTEVALHNLRKEYSSMINSEKNKHNADKMISDEANTSSALKNIESIKHFIENDDKESVMKLQSVLEEANTTCSTLRCMLQLEQNKYHDLTEHLKEEINQCKLKMNFEQDVMQNLKNELANAKQELQLKNNLIKELNSRFSDSSSENGLKSSIYADSIIGNLPAEYSNDVEVLKQQLEVSKKHLEKYSYVFECSEKDLKALSEEFDKYKKETDFKLQDSLIRENHLKDQCKNLETKISSCSEEILLLQNKLNTLESSLAEKGISLEKAIADIARLSNSVQIAEDKFTHEIVLHSADIQALAQYKQQLLEANQKINNLECAKTEMECSLRENIELWTQRENMITSKNNETIDRLNESNKQNQLLHEQIQSLSAKLNAFNTSRNDTSADMDTSICDADESKSSEQLLQIIKHLRKEKDIFMTKLEIMQTENQRIKSQLESTESQLDDVKLKMKTESPAQFKTEKHSGVIRKVETLNAMSDCFVDLRKERDSLLAKVKEVSNNYNKLSETVIPIQQNNCELIAKINSLQTENDNLNKEIIKWKNRTNALLEKDDLESTENLKKLHNEQENLLKKLSAEKENVKLLNENISKQKLEINHLKTQMDTISKQHSALNEHHKKTLNELLVIKKDLDKTNTELSEVKSNLAEKVKESTDFNAKLTNKDEIIADIRNKEAQVRKIGKKYKIQYEELLKTVEEEKKKSAALVSEAAVTSENHLEKCKVFEQKTMDLERNHEEKLTDLKTQISSCADENKVLQKEVDSLKASNLDKEEKMRLWHKQAKSKIVSLSEAKENLTKELNETKNKLEVFEQSKDENDVRYSLLKSQYDGRLAKLEKEKSMALQEKQNEVIQLSKQIESLMQKINQMQKKMEGQQTPKPSTSGNQGEKCTSETPTANIKPMAGVVSQRDTSRRTSGETPLASIRPMASHTGVRTAAVLPTTAQLTNYSLPLQTPHTTGSISGDMLSSPSSSHGTEYMPSSSSTSNRMHPQHSRHVTLPPPESTQDIDTELTGGNDISNMNSNNVAIPQSVSPQVVALVSPRMENNTSEMQTSHLHQQQASSSSNNNSSSSTVTTSHGPTSGNSGPGNKNELHRGFKRPQIVSPQLQQKTILKRPKLQAFQRVAENEADYQIPTSSQRDQEDEMMNFGDSEDEDSYQPVYEIDDDENDLDDKERSNTEMGNTTDSRMSEEQEATGSNNEVDVADESSQEVRSSLREDIPLRCDEAQAEDRETALIAPIHEPQIEAISSGTGIASGSSIGSYENADKRVVPSIPNIFVPPIIDNESGNIGSRDVAESPNTDHTSQISQPTSEAEVGDSSPSGNIMDDDLPTVSSQSTSSFTPQVEEGREAEAISTASNSAVRGSWRKNMKNNRGTMSPQINRNLDQHQRPSPIVWNTDGNIRRGSFIPQRGLQRGARHILRRPNFYKRY